MSSKDIYDFVGSTDRNSRPIRDPAATSLLARLPTEDPWLPPSATSSFPASPRSTSTLRRASRWPGCPLSTPLAPLRPGAGRLLRPNLVIGRHVCGIMGMEHEDRSVCSTVWPRPRPSRGVLGAKAATQAAHLAPELRRFSPGIPVSDRSRRRPCRSTEVRADGVSNRQESHMAKIARDPEQGRDLVCPFETDRRPS